MTPAEARKLECRKLPPISTDETLGSAVYHTCSADKCMSWRWLPLMADTAFTDAVAKAAVELKDETHGRSKAAAHVQTNRAKYGLPVKPFGGYCGRDGKP